MAKGKKKVAKKKVAKKAKPISLPNGYKVIGRSPNWDVDKNPVIEGERSETREVVFNEGKRDERTVRCFIVTDQELGAVTVWESTGLRDLFDQTEEGNTVRIEYLGVSETHRKGQQPMKLFNCAMKD